VAIDGKVMTALERLTTATITTVLLKKGLRNVWVRKSMCLDPGQPRLVGPAFTLRFVPGREDLATPESLASPISTRFAIEDMPADCIAVVDSCNISDAGVFGDILCARMKSRGVKALVTDGAVRDIEGVRRSGLPVWCSGISAPPSVAHLTFVGWQQPIGCGGVAIFPDDIIVADQDGAVVIPRPFVDAVVELGTEGEALEEWILHQVTSGEKLPGLYPPNEQKLAEYKAWREASKTTWKI
jgi:regulator of RNase E activity RraA